MVSKVMFSSAETSWGTPFEFFQKIDDIFHFNLDVCANEWNAKVSEFISPAMDAFDTPWKLKGWAETRAWMNPPYGKGEKACKLPHEKCKKKKCVVRGHHIDKDEPGITYWVKRAAQQSKEHSSIIVALVPARTDAKWFQTIFTRSKLICFVRGRIKFDTTPGEEKKSAAAFPSVVAVFSEEELRDEHYERMSELGNVIDPREGQIVTYER